MKKRNLLSLTNKVVKTGAVMLLATMLCAGCGKEGTQEIVSGDTIVTVSEDGTVLSVTDANGNVTEIDDPSMTVEEARELVAGAAENAQTPGNASSEGIYSSAINTGNLTAEGRGYEGIEGTGNFNYGEALQKSLLFYELQRSGDLPEETRCNWRGDSALHDGEDNGLDLTGGWYDAGDHVKFNLPMSYSAAMLGWSIYEDYDAYEESGQLSYALANVKWANDYFIKCHPSDEVYYYQVGNGGSDHSWWGPCEVIECEMQRPSYCVTRENPGSAVVGGTAASLAICSILYEDVDSAYSALCLEHAKSLFTFADSTKSDAGYTMADGFYNSWSGFYDELTWAAIWLYLATDEDSYLNKAKEYYPLANQDYNWAMCWDDVHIGAALMLAKITGDSTYTTAVEQHLDWWTTGTADGERITYTPQGLAWLDSWGSIRYATTTAYIAAVYSEWEGCPAGKVSAYWDFAVSQADYALGSTGFSYLIGFGDNYPHNPHHRTAQGSYCDNMNEPAQARHTLYGALVGGPDASDNYTDEVSNYNTNEVACDYNAGFTGLMAKLYSRYHGKTLIDFGAVEEITVPEFFVEAGVNVEGQDFVEIRAFVNNQSAWPARASKDLELRYYIDLSEVYAEGKTADQIEISTNYMQSGTAEGLKVWDEENHIYYLSVCFGDGDIYPGGQSEYKCEIQVRLRNPEGAWDNSNDPSFAGLTMGTSQMATGIALYEGDKLIFGTEPAAGENAGQSVLPGNSNSNGSATGNSNTNGTTNSAGGTSATGGTASSESVSVTINYAERSSSASSISGEISIKNTSDGSLDLSDLTILYYFTKDNDAALNFACYHSAINGAGGAYTGLNATNGTFQNATGENVDTVCRITFGDSKLLEVNDTVVVNFCINHGDWSNFTLSNDYSAQAVNQIVIQSSGNTIFGEEP